MTEPIAWVNLLQLVVHGPSPEPTVRGRLHRAVPDEDSPEAIGFAGFGHERPVLSGVRPAPADFSAPLRVWRDGQRVRIEEESGRVNLIADDETCWQFDDGEVPRQAPRSALHFALEATGLLARRAADEWVGDDFTRPTGPIGTTTFLGRDAFTVELAPPPHKPYPLQWVVDAETGLILQQRNDAFGTIEEWTEFVVGEPFDDSLFRWDGPVRKVKDQRARQKRRREKDRADRQRWFEANVALPPIPVELALDVVVHRRNEATGEFEASLGRDFGIGSLARRPLSDAEWPLGWMEIQHTWRDEQWEWAVTINDGQLSPDGLERLRRHLSGSS